jgi:hypothetical protein
MPDEHPVLHSPNAPKPPENGSDPSPNPRHGMIDKPGNTVQEVFIFSLELVLKIPFRHCEEGVLPDEAISQPVCRG